MSPDLKLKVVAEEIKDILKKHDVAGAIALHLPGHGEHFIHINTNYSCAYIYEDNSIHIYSKKEDYSSIQEQGEKQAKTANMFKILTDLTARNFFALETVSNTLDKTLNATHSEEVYTSNKSKENGTN